MRKMAEPVSESNADAEQTSGTELSIFAGLVLSIADGTISLLASMGSG
jgi:hypothetical protein